MRITNKLMTLPIDEDFFLIWNQSYGVPILVSRRLYERISLLKKREIQAKNKSVVPFSSIFIKLLRAKILIDDEEEIQLSDRIKDLRARLVQANTFSLTFIPSYICNFDCEYCLVKEKRKIDVSVITPRLIDRIPHAIEWLKKLSPVSSPLKNVHVKLLGGEPTYGLNWKLSLHLLHVLGEKEGIMKRCTLITNGSFLTREKIQQFLSFGGSDIQLTFDSRVRSRQFFYKRKDVDLILNIAEKCVDGGISTTIIALVDRNSIRNRKLEIFLDRAKERDLARKIIVKPQRVLSIEKYDPTRHEQCKYQDFLDYELFKQWGVIELIKEKIPESYRENNNKIELQSFPCLPAQLASLCVFPNGDLTLCGKLYASNNPPLIGCLRSEPFINEEEVLHWFRPLDSFAECIKCDFALFCGGKCILNSEKPCLMRKEATKVYLKHLARNSRFSHG